MASKFLQGVAMEYGDNKLQGEKRRNGAHTVSVLITQKKTLENRWRQLRSIELLFDKKDTDEFNITFDGKKLLSNYGLTVN